jgi:hypothetical protein
MLHSAHKENPLSDSKNGLSILQAQQSDNQQALNQISKLKKFGFWFGVSVWIGIHPLRLFKSI